MNHTVTTNIKHADLLSTPRAGESAPVRQSAAKDAQNILMIGSDSRGSVADGRSDVIVLVHISSDRKKVYLVHFPRDLYVDVPGHGSGGPGYNTVHVGLNHLNGKAALEFVRERMPLSQGDISRGRRQEAFIKALMLQSVSKQTLVNPCASRSSWTRAPDTSRWTTTSQWQTCARRLWR